MARNSMNLNASLRLNSKEFKRGVASIQKSLASLKGSFLSLAGALGAGLGFTQLISNIKDTAVQLSVAKNTLENVSNVTKKWSDGVNEGTIKVKNYGENLAFVKKMASDYSQDLVALMQNFAQFHAACEKTNLDLENQKLVFESLTKAAAYYHMSADRTKDMMNAITQMMSKGKVAAEELRRQLGNSLPGAFNLMAAALGVSNAELDDMMRKGQVLAADALPRFAAMLNTVTQNADFNSLQMSLNRLKNTWYEFVENSNAEGMFNGMVNSADRALGFVSKNMEGIKASIKGLIVAIASYKLFTGWKAQGTQYLNDLEAQLKAMERQIDAYAKKTAKMQYSNQVNINPDGFMIGPGTKQDAKAIVDYNRNLIKANALQNKLYGTPLFDKSVIDDIEKYNANLLKTHGITEQTQKSFGVMKTLGAGVSSIVKSIGTAIKSWGIMAIVSAILGVITKIVSEVKALNDETKRIANLGKEYEASVRKVDQGVEAANIKLRAQLKIVKDTHQSDSKRLFALKEINKTLGLVGDNQLKLSDLKQMEGEYDKITAAVERWCKATITQAKIQVQANRAAAAQARMQDIEAEKAEKRRDLEEKKQRMKKYVMPNGSINPLGIPLSLQIAKTEKEIENLNEEFEKEFIIAGRAEQAIKDLGITLSEYVEGDGGNGGGGGPASDISKVFEKFNEQKQELINQLKEGAITQKEYNDAMDKLVTEYWKNAAGTGAYSIEQILEKADRGKTLTAMEKWYKQLYEASSEAAQRVLLQEANDAIEKSIDDAIKEMDDALEADMKKWIEESDKTFKADMEALFKKKPKFGSRDGAFDYKKTQSEETSDELDVARDNIKLLEDYINDVVRSYDNWEDACDAVKKKIAEARAQLAKMKQEASTLEQVMKIQQIDEDIKKLGDDINKAWTGGIKDVAQSADRLVDGIKRVGETLDDPKATEWEQLTAVFNEVIQIVDTLISLYETFNTISQLTNTLQEAKNSRQAEMNRLLTEEIGLRLLLQKIQQGNLSDTEKQIIADIVASKAAKTKQAAKSGEAVAGATAAGAELPFPYNLAAIAAGVASVLAALSSASKFAEGGIVGGNSYSGDRQMARVNSGEMILNKAQQGTLWNMLNGKGGLGGNVQFKIKGTDLIGVMNNEMSRRRG